MARALLCGLAPLVCAALFGCSSDRTTTAPPLAFDTDVAPILRAHCVSCHAGPTAAAGWDATTFLTALGCVAPSGAPATLPSDARAPLLSALGTSPHTGLLDAHDRAALDAWVAAGARAFTGTVHTPDIIDPRAGGFHGALLREKHWSPMLDPNDPGACGRCHEGTPVRPAGVTVAAPGAPACTTCHAEPQGVLACPTCHGSGARSYPPRDLCFFPGDATAGGAHAAHVQGSAARPGGYACSTCHPNPPAEVIGAQHGNGIVDVVFDPNVVAAGGTYDATSGSCTVSCHHVGGARPTPAWSETAKMGCSDCHGSPPANHFPGSCNNCHAEANAQGTALSGGPLHLNGTVDLGDGSGRCGACHGHGDDPWPSTAAHPAHHSPSLSAPVACTNCHAVPQTILDSTHLDGTVHVTFGGLAAARGATPRWDGRSCASVACHGANLADPVSAPQWTDTSGAPSKCGACHGVPPSQHTTSTSCGWSNCHGSEVGETPSGTPLLTPSGLALHVNGVIDVNR